MFLKLRHYQPAFQTRECHADDGSGGTNGGGSPSDANGGGGTPSSQQPDWAAWTDTLKTLPDRINASLGDKLDKLNGTVTQLATAPDPDPPPLPNFDEMGNGDIVNYMTGQVGNIINDAIEKALAPFADQIVGLRQDFTMREGKDQVAAARAAHKDIEDWKPEMIALANAHQTLNVEQIYQLARSGNAEKATQLDLKYNPPAIKPRPFALGPGFPAPKDAGQDQVLDKNAAILAAGREVASRHPGVLRALQDL